MTNLSTDDKPGKVVEWSRMSHSDHSLSTVWISTQPTVRIPVDSLVLVNSPRLDGPDDEHVRLLAESAEKLPPIIVHRCTRQVIDGAHRVAAARLNGADTIEARLVDCDDKTAFVLAVRTNIAHGLPLSRSDRSAAALRIIESYPEWSDRAVASATALSDKTVSRIRDRATAGTVRSHKRLGRDGRYRPVDSSERRLNAADLIRRRPDAGLREVARATGLSPATVRDVKQRLSRGEDPVPARYQPRMTEPSSARSIPRRDRVAGDLVNRDGLLERLRNDPALWQSAVGREAVRWLHRFAVDEPGIENPGEGVPDRWAPLVARLAWSCSTTWAELAQRLEQREEG